ARVASLDAKPVGAGAILPFRMSRVGALHVFQLRGAQQLDPRRSRAVAGGRKAVDEGTEVSLPEREAVTQLDARIVAAQRDREVLREQAPAAHPDRAVLPDHEIGPV